MDADEFAVPVGTWPGSGTDSRPPRRGPPSVAGPVVVPTARRLSVVPTFEPYGLTHIMKLIDHRRSHRPVLCAPIPPSLARVPLVDLCACKHPRESHEHYYLGDDCAQCGCQHFRRVEPSRS